jgi:serine protease Do
MSSRIVLHRRAALSFAVLFALITCPYNLDGAVKSAGPNLATAIIEVAEKSIPSVVHINVVQKTKVSSPLLPFLNDPFFKHFFEDRAPKKSKRELRGVGSGIIIRADGHIITTSHVVENATKIQVLLSSGEEYPAKVIGADSKTDLAVIKIEPAKPLPFLKFGDSDKVVVGEWVIAIGHPRGLDQTVTQGIISAKNRRGITDPSSYQDYLQTDAAINPGNSGGPLLNLGGEVIGINGVIASASGGFEGIGFAVPSNIAIYVMGELIANGKVERGWLGVSVQDLTYDLAKKSGLEKSGGALVAEVTKSSPAAEAGVKTGDVILELNGKPVPDAGFLRNSVAATRPGTQANLVIWRDGKKTKLAVKIGNQQVASKILASTIKEKLGIDVRAVSPKESDKFELGENTGVVVENIASGSPLAKAGLERGDIILEINGEAVEGVDSFNNLLINVSSGRQVEMTVLDHRTGRVGSLNIQAR